MLRCLRRRRHIDHSDDGRAQPWDRLRSQRLITGWPTESLVRCRLHAPPPARKEARTFSPCLRYSCRAPRRDSSRVPLRAPAAAACCRGSSCPSLAVRSSSRSSCLLSISMTPVSCRNGHEYGDSYGHARRHVWTFLYKPARSSREGREDRNRKIGLGACTPSAIRLTAHMQKPGSRQNIQLGGHICMRRYPSPAIVFLHKLIRDSCSATPKQIGSQTESRITSGRGCTLSRGSALHRAGHHHRPFF